MEENEKEEVLTSQETNNIQEPKCLHKFSVGAFFLNGIWGICHEVWLSLLCFIPYVNIVMAIVLGFKGNQWAWEMKKGSMTAEKFDKQQSSWAIAGWSVFALGVSVVRFIIVFIIVLVLSEES